MERQKRGSTASTKALPHLSLAEMVFENELILEKILDNLAGPDEDIDLENLETCRLVRNSWNNLAKKKIRNYNWKTRNFIDLTDPIDLHDYLETFETHRDSLFSCYDVEINSNHQISEKFFAKFGLSIKGLNLNFTSASSSVQQFQNILQSISSSVKELRIPFTGKGLQKLENVQFGSQKKFQQLDLLCLALANHATSDKVQEKIFEILLSKISARKTVKICLMNWRNYVKTAEMLQKYNQVQNLKVLDIPTGTLNQNDLKIFSKLGLQLQFLQIHYPESPFDENDPVAQDNFVSIAQNIFEFLLTQKNSLEMLSWGSSWNYKFPSSMPQLRKLNLVCSKLIKYTSGRELPQAEQAWARSCGPILYKKYFPNLDELHITSIEGQSSQEFQQWYLSPQEQCHSVKKLVIGYSVDFEIMSRISFTFPTLKYLEIEIPQSNVNNRGEIFSAIWNAEFRSTLEELIIEFPVITSDFNPRNPQLVSRKKFHLDSILSGLDAEEIQKQVNAANGNWTVISKNFVPPPSSLLSLKCLKKLVMFVNMNFKNLNDLWDQGNVTEYSGYCLFGKIETLEYLHLENTMMNFENEDCLDYLKSKITISPVSLSKRTERELGEDTFRVGFPKSRVEELGELNNLLAE